MMVGRLLVGICRVPLWFGGFSVTSEKFFQVVFWFWGSMWMVMLVGVAVSIRLLSNSMSCTWLPSM